MCRLTAVMLIAAGVGVNASVAAGEEPMRPEAARLVDMPDELVCRLDNGMVVIVKRHPAAPIAAVRMYVAAGSIHEGRYLGSGMSHLFEHLLMGGATRQRSEADSEKLLDEIGGVSNAYTTYDHACYYIETATRHLPTAVDLLADWITNPTFPDEAFQRELGVVQRELERHADNPARQMHYLTMETLYRRHPARYPVIGHVAAVRQLTRRQIVEYHRQTYVPDRVILSIAGDVAPEEVLALVRRQFAHFDRRPSRQEAIPDEPAAQAPRSAFKPMPIRSAILRLAWPTIRLDDPDLYALDVLSHVLSEGDSSILYRTLCREKRLAYSLDGFSWTPYWARGVFAVTCRLQPANTAAATEAILDRIAHLQEHGVAADALARAQRQKVMERIVGQQTAAQVAAGLATDYLATGDPHFWQRYVDGINAVTPDELVLVARRYLRPERMARILVGPPPDRPEVPPDLAEAAQASPIRKITLPNGLRVLLRRNPAPPLVAVRMFFLGGLLAEDRTNNGISRMMARLAVRGTRSRTAEDIAAFFDARGARLEADSGNNTFGFGMQVLAEDLADAIEVLADCVTNPAFGSDELTRLRPQLLDQINRRDEDWRSQLYEYFRNRFFVNSPYRFMPSGRRAVVASLRSRDLLAFHQRLAAGSNAVLAVFGDLDLDQTQALVTRHFSKLPGPAPRPLLDPGQPDPPIDADALYVRQAPPGRRVAGLYMGFRGVRYTDTDEAYALDVLDAIISGYHYPGGWLHEALRGGQRDLVYEVHAINFKGLRPGFVGVYAACQPDKVNEVYRIIAEHLDRARRGEFTREELARAKGLILTSELMARQTNDQQAQSAAIDELYGLGYGYHDRLADHVDAVTLARVRAAAAKYLTHAVITVITPDPAAVKLGIDPAAVELAEEPTDPSEPASKPEQP